MHPPKSPTAASFIVAPIRSALADLALWGVGESGVLTSRRERAPWPADFPDTVLQSPPGGTTRVKDHPDYEAAKAGDAAAAARLVGDTITEAALGQLARIIAGRQPVVVGVHGEEATGRNAIPAAYVVGIADALGLRLERGIVQANRPRRTGSDAWHRLVAEVTFSGRVKRGADYLIVDDVIAQGGTAADLRGYIQARGGNVIGATALTGWSSAPNLAVRPETLAVLRQRLPGVDEWLREVWGHDAEELTDAEAKHLGYAPDLDAVRNRFLEAARRTDTRPDQGVHEGDRDQRAAARDGGLGESDGSQAPAGGRLNSPRVLAPGEAAVNTRRDIDALASKGEPEPVTRVIGTGGQRCDRNGFTRPKLLGFLRGALYPSSPTAIAFVLAFMLVATTAVAQGRPPSTSDTRADWCRRNAGGAPTAGEVILRRDWGEHRAIVTNQDTRWAVAKLRGVDGRVAVAAFVAPRWTTTIADIPAGQYRIEFAFGDLWSRGCNTFVGDASAHRFPDYDAFTTEFDADGGRVVQNWRYTITPVRNGNVRPRSMSMAEFDAN